jgi:hypothetical protein
MLSMRRRAKTLAAFATVAASAAALLPAGQAGAAPVTTEAQAYQVGTDAYVYGVALMEFLRLQREHTSVTVPNAFGDSPFNQLSNERHLTGAAHQPNVQINNDTLYTYSHLDLSRGPLVLHIPRIVHHRYFVMQFLDPYTNDFAYVGTRTTGDGGGNWAITGPGFHGRLPAGVKRIRSRYNLVWLSGRTLVYGQKDLPAVHKVQNGYKLIPLRAYERHGLRWSPPRPRHVIRTPRKASLPTGIAFFDQLGTALAQSRPPARDARILSELATAGIGPGRRPSEEHLSAAVLAGLTRAANDGQTHIFNLRIAQALPNAARHNGWFVPPPDTGFYGTDYVLRAIIAVNGIGANRPQEAVYPIAFETPTGAFLTGGHAYVLHFAANNLPPARYFWSLTMYNEAFYLIQNPINRYSIGNRTPGVKYNRDRSLDIYIQSTPPAGRQSNWLPSPTSGRFEVTLRMYGPKASVLRGSYHYPSVAQVS